MRYIQTRSLRYPLTAQQVLAECPSANFADPIRPHTYYRGVIETAPPSCSATERYVERTPQKDDGGFWRQMWEVVPLTQEEIDAITAAQVPAEVTMRQARRALLQTGRLNLVEDALNALPEPQRTAAKIEWEYSSMVQRSNAFTSQLILALGMNQQEADDLFRLASTL